MLLGRGDRNIHFDLLGAAQNPVVCLAHALSADMGLWAEQVAPLLAAGWRVLRLDLRGHGGSTPGAEEAYSMSGLAADLVTLLDALGLQKIHFAGVSIGGMIGQVLGLEHPGRIASLMLCCTAATNIPGGESLWDERFVAIRAAGSLAPLAEATMGRWLGAPFRAANPGRWGQIRATIEANSVPGYVGGGGAIRAFDVRDRLHRISAPTLVVWGAQDTGTPPAGNRLIAEAIPGARAQEFAAARHIPMVEFADPFSRAMLDWLREQRG